MLMVALEVKGFDPVGGRFYPRGELNQEIDWIIGHLDRLKARIVQRGQCLEFAQDLSAEWGWFELIGVDIKLYIGLCLSFIKSKNSKVVLSF